MLRFDDDMLVSHRLNDNHDSGRPLMHLRHRDDGGLSGEHLGYLAAIAAKTT